MQNGIEKAAVNMGSTAPAPIGPSRRTWNQRGYAAHQQGGEDHPRQVRLASSRRVGHDHRRNQQCGASHEAELKPVAEGGQYGRVFVRPRSAGSEEAGEVIACASQY